MAKIKIFFLTSIPEDKLSQFSIYINKKKSSQYNLDRKENVNISINEMKLSKTKEEEIEFDYDLNYKNKQSSYIIKLKKEKNRHIYFIFNMKSKLKNKNNIQIDSLTFLLNNETFINDNLSKYEKFSYFYKYLFEKKGNFFEEKSKQYYIGLILSFLKEINSKDLIPIDIIISILVSYSENLDDFLKIIKGIQINLEDINYIPIQSYEKIFSKGIISCLNNLLNMNDSNKNIILELILIYFIKFKNKDINIILQKKYIHLLISLFQQNKFLYLKEEIIDEDITQKIVQHIPQIENIIGTYKTLSNDYISYLKLINNNFEDIYKTIEKLKSLKGIFKVDLEVSQNDNIYEFAKLHQVILEKQKSKGKYFISFLSIIKTYYELYKKYENLNGLSELLEIINLEIKAIS